MAATSDVVMSIAPDAVLALGDMQYEGAEEAAFAASYDQTWGRFEGITHPAPGNHEYVEPDGNAYFAYFGEQAGEPGQGWYSVDLGAWHVVALNSNCFPAGGCDAGSPQVTWLREDLAASRARCTLAFWHHPRFTSGITHPDEDPSAPQPFWEALYEAGADVVLVAHEHNFERFAPQDPTGRTDLDRGIRQFVVGTGGKGFYPLGEPAPNSEVGEDGTFGVLTLRLQPDGYEWEFVPVEGQIFTDQGHGVCH